MNSSITPPLRKFFYKLALIQGIILIFFISLSLTFTFYFKKRLSEQLAYSNRSALLTDDFRRVILDMQPQTLGNYVGVTWKQAVTLEGFSIPDQLSTPGKLLFSSITIPIYFDDQGKELAGDLIFYYNRWETAPFAFLGWILFLLFSLPIVFFEKKRLIREYNLLFQLRINESTASIAAQVAHDIRSPLAALDNLLEMAQKLPEEMRLLIRSPVLRIKDIANDLSLKTKEVIEQGKQKGTNIQLLSGLLDLIISEKRIAFRSKMGLEIEEKIDADSYGLFAKINPAEFKRVISNIINNSVESIEDKGFVHVSIGTVQKQIEICIQDSGKGIPSEILSKLGQEGETHGKPGGSGLGLYHAKKQIEEWGGELVITSKVQQGTTVKIRLPRATAPTWFIPSITIPSGTQIIVLDDEPSIHHIWQNRFDSNPNRSLIRLLHFTDGNEASQWIAENHNGQCLYLMDFELINQTLTGLDIIKKHDIGAQSILITSRAEDQGIIKECNCLGVKLIPKSLAPLVPIQITQNENLDASSEIFDVIHIEDEVYVQWTWKEWAAKKNIKFLSLSYPGELTKYKGQYGPETTFYIDNNFGDEHPKGVDFAKGLYDQGMRKLYLSTGSEPENFSEAYWVTIIRKNPPG